MTNADVRVLIKGVIACAAPAPIKWAVGDISRQIAGVRLCDPKVFAKVSFDPTGYLALDEAIGGGWAAGECSTISAPSAMGKTVFAVNLAYRASRIGVPVGIISLEMPDADIWKLACCIGANLKRLSLRHGNLTATESGLLSTELTNMAGRSLFVFDRTFFPVNAKEPEAPTMDVIGKLVRDGIRHYGIRLWFVDYLAKIGPFGDDDLTRMPRLTTGVLDLVRRTGVHFCCLMQANKSAFSRREDKTKKLTIGLEDTKGTIETVADFDTCIGLIRDDWNSSAPVDPAPMSAVVLKARHGPGGTVPLEFFKATGRILEPVGYQSAAAPTPASSASTNSPGSSAEGVAEERTFYRPQKKEESGVKFSGKLCATNQP